MKTQDLIGTWRGGGQTLFNKDGSVKSRRGPKPSYILYTPEGYMMVLSTDPTGVSTDEPAQMSAPDKVKAADACVAYCGPYEIKEGTVYHHIEVALFPAQVGKTLVRKARLDGKRLTYITEPNPDGSVTHIYWDKLQY
jgi:hypothetical protein